MLEPEGTQLLWIEGSDLDSRFLTAPFPPRPHRGPLGPLVRSLRALGLICPILARPREGALQVVCGYRRLLAARAAGVTSVPVLVSELDDAECRKLFAAENREREPFLEGALAPPAGADLEKGSGRLPVEEELGEATEPREPETVPAAPRRVSAREAEEPRVEPEGVDLPLAVLARRAQACFSSIAATRLIPVEDVETIASDLIALAPLRRGKDLRQFGQAGSCGWLTAHSLMVSGLGIHLVEALNWTPGQVKKFALACLLHDVGMLFIPPEVLLSPLPLNPTQRALVERHPLMGREILQSAQTWGAQIQLVAQDHHERWDGSGYPAGRKGNEVDLPARLVGFLDTFAALISPRPHRPALLYTQALRVLAASTEMGLHDPAILLHARSVFTDLPVGSCLRLEDGRLGRVVGSDPRDVRRRRVRILGSRGARQEPLVWVDSEAALAREVPPPGQSMARADLEAAALAGPPAARRLMKDAPLREAAPTALPFESAS